MSQSQIKTHTSQPSTTSIPFDPIPLLQSNSPSAIILSIAILLWVLRPVMLQQKSYTSEKSAASESKPTRFGKRAIAFLMQVLKPDSFE
ncbi:MAG: hypothetical protein V7K97_11280 [Nostoc sp.]|uniref:hypothetical protein n=1 Tax=Nostoc sp. TaxID=1180 RepID=UPI002FF633C4